MLAELATQFSVHPTQITEWKQQLLTRAIDVFGGTKSTSDAPDLDALHAKIRQLALERVFSSLTTERTAAKTYPHASPGQGRRVR